MENKKIADYIQADTICLNLKSTSKNSVIKELFENLKKCSLVKNEELALNDIFLREKMGTTGIGRKIALPHAKTKAVDELIITFGISKNGIEYESLDEDKVNIFFMFLCPENQTQEYLRILARISRFIREERFVDSLLKAKTNEEIVKIIREEEN